jgi:hypothetical protein
MRSFRFSMPVLIALLSLVFMGPGPNASQQANRRHVSSCEDPSVKPRSAALPTSLFSFVRDDNTRQAAEAYSLFLQAMQVSVSMLSLTAPSMYGYNVPLFPSYSMPVDHYIAPVKPDLATLAWGGGSLLTDPKLQYLIQPTPLSSQSVASGSLNSLVDLPVIQTSATLGFSVGNNLVAPAAALPLSLASLIDHSVANTVEVFHF